MADDDDHDDQGEDDESTEDPDDDDGADVHLAGVLPVEGCPSTSSVAHGLLVIHAGEAHQAPATIRQAGGVHHCGVLCNNILHYCHCCCYCCYCCCC